MKIPIKYVLLALIVILSMVYYAGRVSVHPKIDRLSTALKSMNDSIAYKDIVINGYKATVAEKDALVLTYKEALEAEMISRAEMRRMHIKELKSKTSVISRLETTLDSIRHTGVVVYDTIVIKDSVVSVPSIRLPFDFEKKTQYTTLTGSFNQEGIMSAKVETSVPLDIYVGIKRGSKDATVMVGSKNPDLRTVYISSLSIAPPDKRWYERPLVQGAMYFGVGYVVGRNLK